MTPPKKKTACQVDTNCMANVYARETCPVMELAFTKGAMVGWEDEGSWVFALFVGGLGVGWEHTVDGRNPAPPGLYKALNIMG